MPQQLGEAPIHQKMDHQRSVAWKDQWWKNQNRDKMNQLKEYNNHDKKFQYFQQRNTNDLTSRKKGMMENEKFHPL